MSSQYTSLVTLYKAVPFDHSYQDGLRASTISTKKAWLDNNYTHITYQSLMFPKIDTVTQKGTIRLDVIETSAEGYNYCYIEDSKGNKKFCFILGCRYINDGKFENGTQRSVYEFDLELDVPMTFLISKDQYVPAALDRHHASTTKYNNYRLAENVPIGEYHVKDMKLCDINCSDCFGIIVIAPNIDNAGEYQTFVMKDFLNIPNSAEYWLFDISKASLVASYIYANHLIKYASQLISIYTVPKAFIPDEIANRVDGKADPLRLNDWNFTIGRKYWNVYSDNFTPELTYKGVTPTNKKLQYYPYHYGRLYNDAGNASEIRFEDWDADWGSTTHRRMITMECSILSPVTVRATPFNYNGVRVMTDPSLSIAIDGLNYEKAIEISNFPYGSCTSDSYAQWVAQNGKSVAAELGIGNALTTIGAGVALATTEVPPVAITAGAITAILSSALSTCSKLQSAYNSADSTSGSISNGTIEYVRKRKTFKFYEMCIKDEFAAQIDHYFTKFGYAQAGEIDTPDDTVRPRFVYIKTLTPCIKPIAGVSEPNNNQLVKLNEIFMNGITLWNTTQTKSQLFNYNFPSNNPDNL